MKVICLVEQYGDRMMAQPQGWGDSLYFEGREPAKHTLITLDLPGLDQPIAASIIAWLRQQTGAPVSRSWVPALLEAHWQPTVLNDFLEVNNPDYYLWTLYEYFRLEDFHSFAERWLPEARHRLAAALAATGEARATQLDQLQPWLHRVFGVLNQAPQRVWREHHDLLLQLDEPRFQALQQGPFQPDRWLQLADQVRSDQLKLNILIDLVRRLVDSGASQEQLWASLEAIYQVPKLAQVTQYVNLFWQSLQKTLRFEANVSGETLDISHAQEQTMALGWPLVQARRVGRLVPGHVALALPAEAGRFTYIAGGRQLKFRVRRAGGQLDYMGNTLLVKGDEGSLYPALLTAEMLDTLANVDPAQALSRIADLNLPPDHPVFQVATAARTDPRYGRILADLLIELTAGLDANVARRLVRTQSARRRRR